MPAHLTHSCRPSHHLLRQTQTHKQQCHKRRPERLQIHSAWRQRDSGFNTTKQNKNTKVSHKGEWGGWKTETGSGAGGWWARTENQNEARNSVEAAGEGRRQGWRVRERCQDTPLGSWGWSPRGRERVGWRERGNSVSQSHGCTAEAGVQQMWQSKWGWAWAAWTPPWLPSLPASPSPPVLSGHSQAASLPA